MASAPSRPPSEGEAAGDGKVAGCDLCRAKKITPWYHEDEVCWIAECDVCDTPMVVWRRHGTQPPAEARAHMLARLGLVDLPEGDVLGWERQARTSTTR